MLYTMVDRNQQVKREKGTRKLDFNFESFQQFFYIAYLDALTGKYFHFQHIMWQKKNYVACSQSLLCTYLDAWFVRNKPWGHPGIFPKNRSCTAGKLQILENWIMLLLCQKVLKNGLEYILYYMKSSSLTISKGSII